MGDKISCLPDDVLYEILSYLTTKEAVATSVLSKRWKPLWRSLPTLNLDDSPFNRLFKHRILFGFDFRFAKMVDTVILSRDPQQAIRKFCLRCQSLLCNPTNVNNWVQAVLKHRVDHFDLELPRIRNIIFDLPCGVLNCKTFVVLKLKSLVLKDFPSVDFPLLRVLHLVGVDFLEHRHLAELLAASPNLEDLKAVELDFRNYEIKGCFKILPNLVRAHIVEAGIPLLVVSNVKFLHIDGAMNTRSFRKSGGQILVFPNLIHIELGSWYYSTSKDRLELLELVKFGPDLASNSCY